MTSCKECKFAEKIFTDPADLYCMNPECDKEISGTDETDHYMEIVDENDTCGLFKTKTNDNTRD